MLFYALAIDKLENGRSIDRNIRIGGFKHEKSAIKAINKDKSPFGYVSTSNGTLIFWKGLPK